MGKKAWVKRSKEIDVLHYVQEQILHGIDVFGEETHCAASAGKSVNSEAKAVRRPMFLSSLARQAMDRRGTACALAQRVAQADRPAVLLQHVGEGFLGKLLERLHAVGGEQVERLPGLVVELYALARHGSAPAEKTAGAHLGTGQTPTRTDALMPQSETAKSTASVIPVPAD
jgi:hypothetical protein